MKLFGSVTMQAQREAPPDMQCKDKFLVQSAIVAKEIVPKEVTGDMVFCGSAFILAVFFIYCIVSNSIPPLFTKKKLYVLFL